MPVPNHKPVTHTLSLQLLRRLARMAFRESISRSFIIEHAVDSLFSAFPRDKELGERLRAAGAHRRRPTKEREIK